MAVDYKSPIYLQLREVVRGKIESGEYPPGMAIPSENELSDMYGVNRLTVRNAIDALVKEGLLKRIQGKGAFVVGDRIERDLDWLSGFRQTFTERRHELTGQGGEVRQDPRQDAQARGAPVRLRLRRRRGR